MAVVSVLFGMLAVPSVLVEPRLAVPLGISADALGLVVLHREPHGRHRVVAIVGAILGTFALAGVAVVILFLSSTKTVGGSSVATP